MTTTHAFIHQHYRHHNSHAAEDAQLMYELKKQHIKIELVGAKRLKDYAGMNPYAAKSIGFPLNKNTILIDKNLSIIEKHRTLKHEIQEMKHMRNGDTYWTAHKKALKEEKT